MEPQARIRDNLFSWRLFICRRLRGSRVRLLGDRDEFLLDLGRDLADIGRRACLGTSFAERDLNDTLGALAAVGGLNGDLLGLRVLFLLLLYFLLHLHY